MAFFGVPRDRGIDGVLRRSIVQVYKLLHLPLQRLYRGLQGLYSALQGFSALAMCIYGVFYGFFGRGVGIVRHCLAINCELLRCKVKLLATIGTVGESREERTVTTGAGVFPAS